MNDDGRKSLTHLTPRYWRSLDELSDDPAFVESLKREFPDNAPEFLDGASRRTFLKLMGASLALAGIGGCTRKPDEKIVPYVRQPEEMVPGKPLYFATALTRGGYARGVIVESHEGRPTKLEGNPNHPASLGAADAMTQAEILNLYDPDRLKTPTRAGDVRYWCVPPVASACRCPSSASKPVSRCRRPRCTPRTARRQRGRS